MGKFFLSIIQKILVVCVSISVQFSSASSDELIPTRPAPFHNLIPRFKMPPGNLLRYKIPQWEVLYFLKYGIVPFIFYDPHFNRTNFITQVHKFKMYFHDGRPNRTSQLTLKDDESFREFLRKHGYPNFNQLPENAFSINNEVAEEINGLLRATGKSQSHGSSASNERENGDKDEPKPTFPPSLEAILKNLDRERRRKASIDPSIGKRANNNKEGDYPKNSKTFWSNFINRYPLTWKYTRSIMGTRNLLMNHASYWMPERFPYTGLGRNTKSFRIGLRNADMDTGGEDEDDNQRDSGGSSDSRKSKTFQTQGW